MITPGLKGWYLRNIPMSVVARRVLTADDWRLMARQELRSYWTQRHGHLFFVLINIFNVYNIPLNPLKWFALSGACFAAVFYFLHIWKYPPTKGARLAIEIAHLIEFRNCLDANLKAIQALTNK